MRRTIAILEDNAERIAAMRECLYDKFPFFEVRFFPAAWEANDWIASDLPRAICFSLDHDLEPLNDHPDTPDPGTGRDVANQLAQRAPHCPVIIHSTNTHAAQGMELVLNDAGWIVQRITPYNDLEWVRAAWLPTIRRAILKAIEATATEPVRTMSLEAGLISQVPVHDSH